MNNKCEMKIKEKPHFHVYIKTEHFDDVKIKDEMSHGIEEDLEYDQHTIEYDDSQNLFVKNEIKIKEESLNFNSEEDPEYDEKVSRFEEDQELNSSVDVSSQDRLAVAGPSHVKLNPDMKLVISDQEESPEDSDKALAVGAHKENYTKRKIGCEDAESQSEKKAKRRKLSHVETNGNISAFVLALSDIAQRDFALREKLYRKMNTVLDSFSKFIDSHTLKPKNNASLPNIEYGNKPCILRKIKSNTWFENIYPTLNEKDFKEHFRICRSTLSFLISQLRPYMEKTCPHLRKSISLEKRIAIGLHYLASSEEYRVVSSLFGIGESTADEIVRDFVSTINTELLAKFIQFPNKKESLQLNIDEFEALLGFPQCIGAVDGCHIPINPPMDVAIHYHNCKGWNSTVLFAVADAQCRFIYVNVGNPGRNNDSFIFGNSPLPKILNSNLFDQVCKDVDGISVPVCLIGDSAFPLQRHLLKPYPEHLPLTEIQQNYNRVFCNARSVVENALSRLKSRFHILYKRMETDIRFAPQIIKACCVLHNVCESLNDKCQPEWINVNSTEKMEISNTSVAGNSGPGREVRDAVANYIYYK